jgi:C-terminal processing protease CtpA/Prc
MQAVSGTDGRFSLSGAAGEHSLRGNLAGYGGLNKDFTLQAGQQLDLGDVPLKMQTAPPGTVGLYLRGDGNTPAAAMVVFVVANGPADRAGMRLGDQVVAVDGIAVASVDDAMQRIRGTPGTPVQIDARRAGLAQSFTILRAQ